MPQLTRIPYLDDNQPPFADLNPMGLPAADPVGGIPRIGDETPLGRFTQPILPPADPAMGRTLLSKPKPPTGVESQRDVALQKLQEDERKDADPYGSPDNHPGAGGRFLHGLGAVGNTLGAIFAPGVERAIPGSMLNRRDKEDTDLKNLQSLSSDASKEGLEDSQAGHFNEETAEMPGKDQREGALNDATVSHLGAETTALQHPQPKSEFELWHAQNPNGTAQEFEQIQKQPLSAEDAKARNAVWDTIAPQYHLPTGQFRAGMSGADATALASAMNNVVGRNQGAQKIVIQNGAAARAGDRTRDAETEREYTTAAKDLNGQFSTASTQSDTLDQAVQELQGGAVGQALGTIKTLVGLAGGKGSGVRITQAELNAIANARGLGGSFEGYINKLEGKGNLSGDQQAAMVQLLNDVKAKVQQKMSMQDGFLDKLAAAQSPDEIRKVQSEYRKGLLGGRSSAPTPAGTGGSKWNAKTGRYE